mgnify:CR=1 FL=1|tara:strand:+ start:7041 stop:7379 length:339 start_codon:yes stop_codon:yes gene_type:complete
MIDNYTFGKFIIDGKTFNTNVKLINDKAKSCRHFDNHIIMKEDFTDLIKAKPDIIIIGTGASGVVDVSKDIIDLIKENKIKLIIKKTAEACDEYNKLIKQKKNVVALLHNTC